MTSVAFLAAGAASPTAATHLAPAAEPVPLPQRPDARASGSPAVGLSLAGGAVAGLALATLGGRRRSQRQTRVARQVAVGDKVLWSGQKGTVRFVGTTHFAAGEWVGVELDEAAGRHDGTFMGVTYFECGAEHGVFSQAAKLQLAGGASSSPSAPAAAAPAAPAGSSKLVLGQRVRWSGHEGTVRFIGGTHFAAGEWVGVELDEAVGRHDGTFMGVAYFECGAQHGVFSPASFLQTTGTSDARVLQATLKEAAAKAKGAAGSAAVTVKIGDRVQWSGHEGTVRFVGPTKFAPGEWIGVELREAAGRHDGSFMGATYFECAPLHGVLCQVAQLKVMALA